VLKESLMKFLKLDGIMENLTGYVETRIELMKLEIREDVAKTLAKATVFVVIGVMALLFIFFISAAIALKIGEATSPFIGFAIVAGFYGLIGVVIWLSRTSLQKKLEQQYSEKITVKKK
jgi:uncharacterized membrane protein YqjE